MPTPQSAKPRRKRCLNDNKLFVPARNVPDQKFCCDACRKEFHHHGSAFGPMKLGLYAAIDKKYAALEKQMRLQLRTMTLALTVLTEDIKSLRRIVMDLDSSVHPVVVHVEPARVDARVQGR